MDDLRTNSDVGCFTILVSVDLMAAFDSSPNILLSQPNNWLGVRDTVGFSRICMTELVFPAIILELLLLIFFPHPMRKQMGSVFISSVAFHKAPFLDNYYYMLTLSQVICIFNAFFHFFPFVTLSPPSKSILSFTKQILNF